MSDTWIPSKLCNTVGAVNGITVDNNKNIYFTMWKSGNVYQVKQGADPHILINLQEAELRGIIWNGNNILYICDIRYHRILSYLIDTGNLQTLAGGNGEGHTDGSTKEAKFTCPRGIAIDRNGDLLITQGALGLCCVRKINISVGTVITIAGSNLAGHKDGPVSHAMFNVPWEIAVTDHGTIYVAEKDNHCIRKISNGIVSTIAGIPGKKGYQDGAASQSLFDGISGLVLDVDGSLLVGDGCGLRRVDMNQKIVSTPQGLPQQRSYCLAKDNENIYVGTEGGVWEITRIGESALNNVVTWKHIRLFLVGDSGAGKTSVVRWLKGEKFNTKHISTDSVDVHATSANDWQSVTFDVLDEMANIIRQSPKLSKNSTQPSNGKTRTTSFNQSTDQANVVSQIDSPKLVGSSTTPVVPPDSTNLGEDIKIPEHFQTSYVLSVKVKTAQQLSFTFHVWDFAGQEEYYNTHHFFLTETAIYLLVVDVSKPLDMKRIQFWLGSIKSYADNAPILILGTHLDLTTASFADKISYILHNGKEYAESQRATALKTLQEVQFQYSVAHCQAISCRYDSPEALRKLIHEMVEKGVPPKQYCKMTFMLFYDAVTKPENCWDYDLAAHINKRDSLRLGAPFKMTETDITEALRFFHQTGFILCYEDIDIIFTRPQQIISVFRSVITALGLQCKLNSAQFKKVKEEGRIHPQVLAWIWKDYRQQLHPQFRLLLQKFGLGFADPAHKEGFIDSDLIIPCLVSSRLRENWNSTVQMQVKIETVPPLGFASRLICRILDLTNIKGIAHCRLFKGGCLFTQNGIQFMIKTAPGEVSIQADVKIISNTIATSQQILKLIWETAKLQAKDPRISTSTKCFCCQKKKSEAEDLQRNLTPENMFAPGVFYCGDCRSTPEVVEMCDRVCLLASPTFQTVSTPNKNVNMQPPVAENSTTDTNGNQQPTLPQLLKDMLVSEARWTVLCRVLDSANFWKQLGIELDIEPFDMQRVQRTYDMNPDFSPSGWILDKWIHTHEATITSFIEILTRIDNETAKELVLQWYRSTSGTSNCNNT